MQEMQVRFLGQEDPLEEEMEPTPVFLPGESHGGLRSIESQRVGGDSATEKQQQKHITCTVFIAQLRAK